MFRSTISTAHRLTRLIMHIFFALLLSSGLAQAVELNDRITITGFASAIYQQTNEPAGLHGPSADGGIDNRGSFQGTKLGLNITANINDRIKVYSQLLGEQGSDNYDIKVDWAFIDFSFNDEFSLRAGKIKFPVGIVNEYVSVGYTYLWLQAPNVFYSTQVPLGPQVTREAYSGASLLWNQSVGDEWTLGADIFAGEVKMDVADVRKLRGITLRADWDDEVLIQASSYSGTMENSTVMPAMNQQPHDVTTFGVKVDMNNIVVYAEIADVSMGTISAMAANTWYTTFGYRIGKWLPHITYEYFEKGESIKQEQNFTTLGLRYDIMENTALKFSLSSIKTEQGKGMFDTPPNDDSTTLFGVGVDVIF
ncbi:MAG: porin [Thiohalomonadales bacterium]